MWNRITPVVKNLLIINFLFWLADLVFSHSLGIQLSGLLGLWNITYGNFHLWQPLTYMFMHGGFSHLFFNMFALFMFGSNLEEFWGGKRFLIYYLLTGIGAGAFQEVVWALFNNGQPAVTIGASGAVFGVLLAFAWLFPEVRMFVFPIPVPIRARIMVIIYAFIELGAGLYGSVDGVAHFAHLGGLLFGLILILIWRKKGVSNMEAGAFDTSALKGGCKKVVDTLSDFFKRIFSSKNEGNDYSKFHYQDPINENKNNKNGNFSNHSTDNKTDEKNQVEKDKEIARILEKIKQSGYDSLTQEEKETLFKR